MAEMSSDVTVAEGKMIALLDNDDERTSLELDVKEATFMANALSSHADRYAIASSGDMTNWKVEGSWSGLGQGSVIGQKKALVLPKRVFTNSIS